MPMYRKGGGSSLVLLLRTTSHNTKQHNEILFSALRKVNHGI